jgi:hypothetical protein
MIILFQFCFPFPVEMGFTNWVWNRWTIYAHLLFILEHTYWKSNTVHHKQIRVRPPSFITRDLIVPAYLKCVNDIFWIRGIYKIELKLITLGGIKRNIKVLTLESALKKMRQNFISASSERNTMGKSREEQGLAAYLTGLCHITVCEW